jgi:hypothetical protein
MCKHTRTHTHTSTHAPKHAQWHTLTSTHTITPARVHPRSPTVSWPRPRRVARISGQLHCLVDEQFADSVTRSTPSNPRARAEKGWHHCVAEQGTVQPVTHNAPPTLPSCSSRGSTDRLRLAQERDSTGKHICAHAQHSNQQ